MRVCFIVSEIFHWGRIGGFGALTRTIGRELVKRGVEVFVITPQSSVDQRLIEKLDGMIVIGVPSKNRYFSLSASIRSRRFFKLCEADIYHSEEPSAATYVATKLESKKKHVVTLQDPRDIEDAKRLWALSIPGYDKNIFRKWLLPYGYRVEDYFIKKALRRVDALFCQAKFVIPKAVSMYNLNTLPQFLPNPVRIPENPVKKAEEPTVCFLGRWDEVKRPELFFELAEKFPDMTFVAIGKSNKSEKDSYLRKISHSIRNLDCPGFVDEETKSEILKKSWIYVNTSIRECLPVAFLEAAAHRCAILSSENPDGFAENFGYHVSENNLLGYTRGLENLLKDDLWKTKGINGFEYIKEVHEMDRVIDQHMKIYEKLMLN
jgi:glycosyltransferase involved in cell wall biosynthesis